MEQAISHEHRDDVGSKMGMWIFIFTELFLFGGLFLIYAVFRAKYSASFHEAAYELNAFYGTLNTVILLISSMTVAMSITALQRGEKQRAMLLIILTLALALFFMVNKYFEWSHKFELMLYPGSEVMQNMEHGKILFFSLYYMTTGLHALHVIIGMVLLLVMVFKIGNKSINPSNYVLLENSGLYWHLVDFIWIFLFPLLYLVT